MLLDKVRVLTGTTAHVIRQGEGSNGYHSTCYYKVKVLMGTTAHVIRQGEGINRYHSTCY